MRVMISRSSRAGSRRSGRKGGVAWHPVTGQLAVHPQILHAPGIVDAGDPPCMQLNVAQCGAVVAIDQPIDPLNTYFCLHGAAGARVLTAAVSPMPAARNVVIVRLPHL